MSRSRLSVWSVLKLKAGKELSVILWTEGEKNQKSNQPIGQPISSFA